MQRISCRLRNLTYFLHLSCVAFFLLFVSVNLRNMNNTGVTFNTRKLDSVHKNEMEVELQHILRSKLELEEQIKVLQRDIKLAESELSRLKDSTSSQKLQALNNSILPINPKFPTPAQCTMNTCFRFLACPQDDITHLRVCFEQSSAVSDSKWLEALKSSPHFSSSCNNACLRVVFSPESCVGNGPTCLYIGDFSISASSEIIQATTAHTLNRFRFDILISPLRSPIVNPTLPIFSRRHLTWLLGANIGTQDSREYELARDLLKHTTSNLTNVVLVNATTQACWSPESVKNNRNPTFWRACSENEAVIAKSTFCLLIDTLRVDAEFDKSRAGLSEQLASCLVNGAVPVYIESGNEPWRVFPFWEILEPHWRRSVVFVSRSRLPRLVNYLQSIEINKIVEMQREGRDLYRRYLSSPNAQLATAFLLLSRRLQLVQPAAPKVKAVGALASGSLVPKVFSEPNARLVKENMRQGSLGPFGTQWDSKPHPAFPLTPLTKVDPFWSHEFTPWSKPSLPVEFQLSSGNDSAYKPIHHEVNLAGVEFAADIGGMYPYEQFTMVILTYNRENVLKHNLENLYNLAYLHSVVVVRNNPEPVADDIPWPQLHVPIYIVKGKNNSLNNRFLPFDIIKTEAVFVCDDDITLRQEEIVFAFRVWRENRERIVGFPTRTHYWSEKEQKWLYNPEYTCEYSMVLTGAAFIHRYYFHAYTYEMPEEIRSIVNQLTNCEDIAMNFLVSHISRQPPIKVTNHWSFPCPNCPSSLWKMKGHKTERSKCIDDFERFYGYNPLIYTQYRADSVLYKTPVKPGIQRCFANV